MKSNQDDNREASADAKCWNSLPGPEPASSPSSIRRCKADAGAMIMKQDFVRSAVFGGLLGLLAGAPASAAPAGAEDVTIKIDNFTFTPQRVTVQGGTP